jgi:hypothetical protein
VTSSGDVSDLPKVLQDGAERSNSPLEVLDGFPDETLYKDRPSVHAEQSPEGKRRWLQQVAALWKWCLEGVWYPWTNPRTRNNLEFLLVSTLKLQ